ncbi:unnamed protein product [Cunninghamella echinulata]
MEEQLPMKVNCSVAFSIVSAAVLTKTMMITTAPKIAKTLLIIITAMKILITKNSDSNINNNNNIKYTKINSSSISSNNNNNNNVSDDDNDDIEIRVLAHYKQLKRKFYIIKKEMNAMELYITFIKKRSL